MEQKETRVLLCFLVRDTDGPMTQSIIEACQICARPVWVALSAPDHDLCICAQCFTDKHKGEKIKVEPPTEAQLQDFEQWRRDNE